MMRWRRSAPAMMAEGPVFRKTSRSSRLQPLARQPGFHLLDVDHVVALDRGILLRDDDPHARVDRIDATGEHLVDGLLVLLDERLEEPHAEVAHLVGVLADGGVDGALGEVLDGGLIQVEGDDRRFLPQLGELADLFGDEVGVIGPEAEEDADIGILVDRGLDVDWALLLSVSSSKTSMASCLALTRNESPAPAKKPSRRSMALAAAAVPTKAAVLPPWGRSILATLPATSPALRLFVPIYARRASFMAVRVDRDHDLSRLLELSHLVGDARRLGLHHGDGHALDVGPAEDVLDEPELIGRPAFAVATHLDLGLELGGAVLHPLLDGVPPVGRAVRDEDRVEGLPRMPGRSLRPRRSRAHRGDRRALAAADAGQRPMTGRDTPRPADDETSHWMFPQAVLPK